MKMSEISIEKYTQKMRCRYSRMTGRRGRGRLLDELVEMTGWDRKHANKVLLGKRRTEGRRGKRGAPTRYEEADGNSQDMLAGDGSAMRQAYEGHAWVVVEALGLLRGSPPSTYQGQRGEH
ncbi:MAG: hypothetical protein ACK49I_02755 [Verrucomicrobiota bacterium]